MAELMGSRVWIIGASSGIGRATALALVRAGARVAVSARRTDLLDSLVAESDSDGNGNGDPLAIPCDVRDPASIESAADAVRESLGGLDALVYCAGIASLVRMRDADAEMWRQAFEVNLMGASLATGAVISDLESSRGRALYLSSIGADERPPRRGLGLYATHKAALNRMIECWQEEEHAVSFTRVGIGDTAGTDMSTSWDPEMLGTYVGEWVERRYLFGSVMTAETVAEHVLGLLRCDEAVPESKIVPRFAAD